MNNLSLLMGLAITHGVHFKPSDVWGYSKPTRVKRDKSKAKASRKARKKNR